MINKFFCILFIAGSGLLKPSIVFAADTELKIGAILDEVGIFIPRENKDDDGQVNLRIVNNKFQLYFLDAENKIIEPDAARAIIHYSSVVRKGKSRSTVSLTPEPNGLYFTAERAIVPPYHYRVRILLKFADEDSNEFLPEKPLRQMGTTE